MAVMVVRAILMMTLHLFLFSLVIVVIFLDFLRDVTVYAKDASAVDEDLGEDVEDRFVNFAGWWNQQSYESEDDSEGEEDDGGNGPLPSSPRGGVGLLRFHKLRIEIVLKGDINQDRV